jgi:hypothetical protein
MIGEEIARRPDGSVTEIQADASPFLRMRAGYTTGR